jgi:hypothetical protein
LASEQFEEFLDIVPLYAQQYAMNMIEGFEDKAPEVQEAILAAIAVDPAAVLNLFQGIGSMAADSVIVGAGVTEMPESPQVTATRYAQALEQASNIVTMANTDFAEAVRMAQEMNLDDLDETTLNSVNLILPQLETLRNLSMQTAEDIASAGGTAVFNQIQPIVDALSNVDGAVFQDIVDRYNATLTNGDVLRTAEEQQEEFLAKLIALATSPEPIEAFRKAYEESIILDDAGNIIGANFQGIEIVGQEAANAFLVGFENIITDFNIPADRLQLLVQDYEKVSEIIKKNPASLTNEDVAILSRYSGLFQDYMNGTLKPTSEYFADITAEILDGVENTRIQIGEAKRLLGFKLMSGQIDQEAYDQQMEQLEVEEAENNLMAERLNFQNEDLDAIKSQIAAYKESFDQAKKIRDLQKEAVALTEKSIQAVRTGATGTIEAEFNRAKLNQEIADANRQLEQNLIMAQLEAQQKVLEDAQQRRILEITDKNTKATDDNTEATNKLAGVIQEFLSSDNTITLNTATGPVTMSLDDLNQLLAINGQQP